MVAGFFSGNLFGHDFLQLNETTSIFAIDCHALPAFDSFYPWPLVLQESALH